MWCADLDNGMVAAKGLACLEHSAAPAAVGHLAPKADALTYAHSFGKGVPWQRLGGAWSWCRSRARLLASCVRSWRGLAFSNSPAGSWLPVAEGGLYRRA